MAGRQRSRGKDLPSASRHAAKTHNIRVYRTIPGCGAFSLDLESEGRPKAFPVGLGAIGGRPHSDGVQPPLTRRIDRDKDSAARIRPADNPNDGLAVRWCESGLHLEAG